MGALNSGLKATLCICGLVGHECERNFRRKMTTILGFVWELISRLHRTSVAQGLLAETILSHSGASNGAF